MRVLHDFAECIAKTMPAEAAAVLVALPDSKEQRVALRILLDRERCLRAASQIEVKASLLRGALAEALYDRSAPVTPTLRPRPMLLDFASFAGRLTAADASGFDQEDKALLTVRWMAYCATHENPVGVEAVLRTRIGREDETLAFRELRPTLSACLFRGHQAVVARVPLRAALAEALYQYYLHANDAPSVAGTRQ
ncbi:MAG TPA: hypothetical protein VFU80_07295 [Sphingomicrobium sp.]|nr:hypothetical protein [Sphingomicrobium sp.]